MSNTNTWQCTNCGRTFNQDASPNCCENCGGLFFNQIGFKDIAIFNNSKSSSNHQTYAPMGPLPKSGFSDAVRFFFAAVSFCINSILIIFIIIGCLLYCSSNSFHDWIYNQYLQQKAYAVMYFSSPLPEDMDRIMYVRVAAKKADEMFITAEKDYWKKKKLSKPGYWIEATISNRDYENRSVDLTEKTCSYLNNGIYRVYCIGNVTLWAKSQNHNKCVTSVRHGGWIKLQFVPKGQKKWFGSGSYWKFLGFEEPSCVLPYVDSKVDKKLSTFVLPDNK